MLQMIKPVEFGMSRMMSEDPGAMTTPMIGVTNAMIEMKST